VESTLSSYLPLLFVAALYILLVRPQQKRRKEQVRMNASLAPGDSVVTLGGLHGIVESLDDATVDLAVTYDRDGTTPDVILRYERSAIARVLRDTVPTTDGVADDEDLGAADA